jgi:hypothetical protein
MSQNSKRVLIVAFVGAGVIALYYLLKSGSNTAVMQPTPNPTASGVNVNTPAAQQYNVAPYQPAPTPGYTFSPVTFSPYQGGSPTNLFGAPSNGVPPGSGNQYFFGSAPMILPPDLTFNQPKLTTLPNAVPDTSSCGCGGAGSCQTCQSECSTAMSHFPDGRGGCMAASRRSQLQDAGGPDAPVFRNYANNLATSGADYLMLLDDFQNSRARLNGETPASRTRYIM